MTAGMNALAALLIASCVTGALLTVRGLSRTELPHRPPRPPGSLRRRWRERGARLGRRGGLLALAGIITGIGLWLASGWTVFLIGAPLAAIGLPLLLGGDDTVRRIERIDALETWTRGLSGLTIAGAGLEQTLLAGVPSAPEALREPLATLAARLGARWRTQDALRAFADDLDDPSADLVVMHLLLAERVRGPGLARALNDLAESLAEEVRMRRRIAADRAKPRLNVRIITVLTLLLLCALPFAGEFVAPYRIPAGQLLLAGWLVLYAITLTWLRRITIMPAPARSLGPRERRT